MSAQGSRSLSQIAAVLEALVDAFATEVALLMAEAQERAPTRFERWVSEDTPFTVTEATRLRALALCYRELPPEARQHLPRMASALSYVFDADDTAPYESATGRFTREDLVAGALLGGDPEALSADVRTLLERWVAGADAPGASQ